MNEVFALMTLQALLGALDGRWHRAVGPRAPLRRPAARGFALHAARALLNVVLFLALAWFEWRGAWVVPIALSLLAAAGVVLADLIAEDQVHRLSLRERAMHGALAMSMGAVVVVLAPLLASWWSAPTGIVQASYGWQSWLLTLFAAAAFVSFLGDARAALRHRRPPEWVRSPFVIGSARVPRVVLVTGATGYIGRQVVRRLLARGDVVLVLTRSVPRARDCFGPHVRIVTALDAIEAGTRIDAIVNLAGAPLFAWPWTGRRRRILRASRIETTREVVALCARLKQPPTVLVTASAVGYYGSGEYEIIDEESPPQGNFLSQLCREWEEAALAAEPLGVRVVRLRMGPVMGRDGGVLPKLLLATRAGLGAIVGSGRHFVSWVHIEDVLRLIEFVLDAPAVRGPVNAVGPQPPSQEQLQRALAQAVGRPVRLRIPARLLSLLMGEMAQLLTQGQRVFPKRALVAGFDFRHEELREVLRDWAKPAAQSPRARRSAPAEADAGVEGAEPLSGGSVGRT
jgi:uncharacterized protein (TIGR01777 family)